MELFVYSTTCIYGVQSVTAPSLFALQPFLAVEGSDFIFYYRLRTNTITLLTYKILVIAVQLSSFEV